MSIFLEKKFPTLLWLYVGQYFPENCMHIGGNMFHASVSPESPLIVPYSFLFCLCAACVSVLDKLGGVHCTSPQMQCLKHVWIFRTFDPSRELY